MWRAVLAAAAALAGALAGARELDPAACATRFDVQRDKIIRTEESREMGARYLSELDVGARHECRRLCCETDACDVFVYEEKSPGSCYLFNCGPPEDFRCKFTAHSNFSSGVLALSRRLAELQDQERLAPPPPPPPPAPAPALPPRAPPPPPPPSPPQTSLALAHTTTTPISATAAASSPAAPAPARHRPSPAVPAQRRCSRYQWECHSGGECIAVYNACDGVPQCADGSDEAPELGCPAAPAPPPAAAPAPPVAAAPAALPPSPPSPPPPPNYSIQVSDREDAAAAAAAGERWPHRLLQAQPRRFPVGGAESGGNGGGSGPHIFSHKGGLVQEEAFEPPPPAPAAAPAPPAWPRRPWPHHNAGAGVESGAWGGWGREWGDGGRAWAAAPPPPPPDVELPPYLSSGTMPELPVLYPQRHASHDQPKKGFGLESAAAPAAPAPPPPRPAAAPAGAAPAPPPERAPSVSPPPPPAAAHAPPGGGGGGGGGAAAARRDLQDEHDGLSERPPAAVLLLVLGVAMTGTLAAAAGCRARAAARRLRRGARPLAHDADYLVNGMYL